MNRKNNKQYSSIPVFARTIGFQTFPVSRIRAFISFLFLLILLTLIAGITAIVFIIHGILPDWAVIAVSLFIFLLGIIYSEGMWFGLTCSRFATLTNDRLVLYGAFGRERFSCPTDWTFEYRKVMRGGDPFTCTLSPPTVTSIVSDWTCAATAIPFWKPCRHKAAKQFSKKTWLPDTAVCLLP